VSIGITAEWSTVYMNSGDWCCSSRWLDKFQRNPSVFSSIIVTELSFRTSGRPSTTKKQPQSWSNF